MRRILVTTAVALAALAAIIGLTAAGGDGSSDKGKKFKVELDNAFGVEKGGDLKIAGVRAGKIGEVKLDAKTLHAVVDITVTRSGFGSLRSDASCAARPQSLIGESFIDCDPGKNATELAAGSLIPVSRTTSSVPPDLVADIMRRPERERLSIIIGELGAAVAGRGEDLNAALRRATPALRQTDTVLAQLAQQSNTLQDLTENADRVLGELADKRTDVTTFVASARDAAKASAVRRAELQQTIHNFPAFLEQLKPAMKSLGDTADAQIPTLRNLDAARGDLQTLFDRLGPFSDATRVNLTALARAARQGRPALTHLTPIVKLLAGFASKTPEVGKNLRIILETLNDRGRAVEADPRSPGGKGYTGIEALLQYVYQQVMAINIYDANSYMLKINLFTDKCADYQNAQSVKEKLKSDPSFLADCEAKLGPSQPGITSADPTATGLPQDAAATTKRARKSKPKRRQQTPQVAATPEPVATPSTQPTATATPGLIDGVTGALDNILGKTGVKVPGVTQAPDSRGQQDLLDFLVGP